MTDFYADLHIHSRFSRATSKSLTLPMLAAWARLKGLAVVGTGDFTHPGWREELVKGLVYDEETALYTPREPVDVAWLTQIPQPRDSSPVYFMLQGEVSSIYKKDGKVRKVHNIIFMPHFAAAHKFCKRLGSIGNLESDGRPMLGLDCRDLLEMVLETAPGAYLIPAHIWTPWYSLFGSKSGFDSIEECFGDLSEHIFALETGLSSDPAMNRLVSALDTRRLVSNSDAHSPENLGREANRFGGKIQYDGMFSALRHQESAGETSFLGTIEFFPQEGKYYADGHRKCELCWTPEETRQNQGICSVCGKGVTVGVLNRVMELADRESPLYPDNTTFQTLVPLSEIIAEIFGQGVKTRKVRDVYAQAIGRFGSEIFILTRADAKDLNRFLNPLGDAVERVRQGEVTIRDGYDGEYGVVRIFSDEEQRTIVREVGEATRPQKKQAQGLTLLGDMVMSKKKTDKKGALDAQQGQNAKNRHARRGEDLPENIVASEKGFSAQVETGGTSGAGQNDFGQNDFGQNNPGKDDAGQGDADQGDTGRNYTGQNASMDADKTKGGSAQAPCHEAEEAVPSPHGKKTDNTMPDGTKSAGAEEKEGVVPETGNPRPEDGSLNFVFSEMSDEAGPEPLPFLPLEQEESRPPMPEELLNFEQRAAAFVDTQPTLVMAGAGTGKTFTLFARLCYLLKQGALPRSLLVVTFTRKAATEIDKKLLEIFGEGAKLPVVDTLYALALDLWHKTHADVPVLLSEESARQVFAEANIEEETGDIRAAWKAISLARQLLEPVPEEYAAFGSRYTAHKSAWNLADYTDLLEFWLEQARSGIFKPLWDYVLIDEIQELSPLGRALVSSLVPSSGRGFFGVGDRDQTLYAVPGDKENVTDVFKRLWPDLRIFSLMTGFRGRKGLLEVAQSILQSSTDGPADSGGVSGDILPDSFFDNASLDALPGAPFDVNGVNGEKGDGGGGVAAHPTVKDGEDRAGSRGKNGVPTNDQAIVQTTAPVSGISSENGSPFWSGQARVASVHTAPACIHLFKAPTDEAEVQWITDKVSVLLGGVTSMPDYAMDRAEVFVPARVYKPDEVAVLVRSKDLGHEIRRSLARIGIGVSEPQSDVFWADGRVRILLQLGCRMLGISLMEREGSDIPDCPDKVVAKGPLAMSAFLSTIHPFDLLFWHSKAFRELVRVYDQSGGWAGLITWIHLQNDLELVRPKNKKVQILTLHAAKGREFPVVFLPCLEEGIIPSAGPLLSGRFEKAVDVEGERRLLYMGAARAQEALFMSHSAKRCLRGADVRLKASRFLDKLPESLVTVSTLVGKTHHQEEQLNLL